MQRCESVRSFIGPRERRDALGPDLERQLVARIVGALDGEPFRCEKDRRVCATPGELEPRSCERFRIARNSDGVGSGEDVSEDTYHSGVPAPRVIVAPQSFKGSADAVAVAAAIGRGVRRAWA